MMTKLKNMMTNVYDYITVPMDTELAERMDAVMNRPEPTPLRGSYPNYFTSHEDFMRNYRPSL